LPPGEFTAVVDWGDGSPTEPAGIAARDYVAGQRQGRSLMTVSGSHTYAVDGTYHGTVTFTRQDQTWAVPFVATGVPSCTSMLTGNRQGPLTVSSGVACLDGATVAGPVTVASGASLYAIGSTVRGPVTASGDVLLCGSNVSGPVTVTGASRVWLGNRNGESAATTVLGPVTVTGSAGQVTIDSSSVGGPLTVRNNSGSTVVSGNQIDGPLSCTGNSPAPTDAGVPNRAAGPKSGQCAEL
jgi:hexosaminidase